MNIEVEPWRRVVQFVGAFEEGFTKEQKRRVRWLFKI
jgi:hypothetical protein